MTRSIAMVLATLALVSCGDELRRTRLHYDRESLTKALSSGEAGLRLGEFALGRNAIVDGDTIRVEGLAETLRLLAIDTEETFKSEKDLRAYENGFEQYLAKKRGKSTRPIKAATPLGMDAKKFGEEFFAGVTTVRVERDHPKMLRDRYGRFLAYVFAEKAGEWVNYNVEVVRAGMSPYFSKYGYSRRFHDEFVQAEQEARAAGRGIWDPSKEHYPDYEERLAWWDARAQVIADFEREAFGRRDYITLDTWDAMDALAEHEGQEVVVLGLVGDVRPRKGAAPARAMLSRKMFSDFPLIFFDDDVLAASGIAAASGEFVRVRGTVTRYEFKNKRRGRGSGGSQLQIEIKRPDQVTTYSTFPPPVGAVPAEPTPAPVQMPPDAPVPPALPDAPEPAQCEPETPCPEPVPPPPPPPAEAPSAALRFPAASPIGGT